MSPRRGGARPSAGSPRDELLRIQRELHRAVGTELGLRVLSTGIRESANAVRLEVVALEERAREALDARYDMFAVQATARPMPVT
jgi:hypothetical protein